MASTYNGLNEYGGTFGEYCTYLATSTAGQEILNPWLARRTVGAGGGNEEVALVFEGIDKFPPEIRTMLRSHIGLTG